MLMYWLLSWCVVFHLWSWFLGEIVVVVDPCVIAVSMVAMRTVVTHVVFAAETLSVAAVVSDPVVWVHHVWSAHRDRLLRFSSASVPLHPTALQTLSGNSPICRKYLSLFSTCPIS